MEGRVIIYKKKGKGLHNLSKDVVDEILKSLPILGEYFSEVSYFIPEPKNFSEVTRFSDYIKKLWLKATPKVIKI